MNSNTCNSSQQTSTKKILVIHPHFTVTGGAEEVLLKTLEALIEQNQDYLLLGKLPQNSIFDNLPITNVNQMPYSDTDFKPKRFPTHQSLLRHLKLKNKLRKKIGNVDLEINTQDTMYFVGSGKKRVAYVHFPVNLLRMQNPNLKHRWFWKLFYCPITFHLKRQIKQVDLLLCNSCFTQKSIMDCWGREAEVVYPPVDVESFKPLVKESLVVSVGRFVSSKRYELVVEVARCMPDVKFVIVGRKGVGDSYFDRIVALKPDNLELFTDVSRGDVSVLLGRAKVYLHCMVGEHFGISVCEAMAAGCVPVVHDSGGPKEIVGGFGFVYDGVEGCVGAVRAALQSDVDPSVVVERAKMFSSDNFKKNFIDVMEKNVFL